MKRIKIEEILSEYEFLATTLKKACTPSTYNNTLVFDTEGRMRFLDYRLHLFGAEK